MSEPALPADLDAGGAGTASGVVLPQWSVRMGTRLLSIGLVGALWFLVSYLVSAAVIPTPVIVWQGVQQAMAAGYLWPDVAITFTRMLGAFALAMLVGVGFGAALGSWPWFDRLFDFWVALAASIPSLLYIVIVYLWLGLNNAAAILGGALVVAPTVTFNFWQGMRSLDPGLSEMARAFHVPRRTIFRRVVLPQTLPFVMATARVALALTWKIMIFVELLGLPSGVGYRIQYWYDIFNMKMVLASALPYVVLMLIVDTVLVRNLDAYLFRWRREELR